MLLPDYLSKKSNTNWVENYFSFDIKNLEQNLSKNNSSFWQDLGQKKALKTFHAAAERVPAYKKFLKKEKIDHKKIKTITDFNSVPISNKQNYINKYSVESRAWEGNLRESKIAASSSGTTGTPNYWLRSSYQEYEAAITHEVLYKKHFEIEKHRTLLIVGFPMGVYVSGIATVLPSWMVAQKYHMTVVSAGNNKAEVLKALGNLNKSYSQVVLVGHPFFIKDVIETGKEQGIKWQNIKLGMMFCSEGFSESWRQYLLKETGKKNTNYTFNTYGSSEMLLIAYETELSINAKEQMEKEDKVAQNILGKKLIPNFFQYNPALRFIQEHKNQLIFTSQAGLPLIRFNLEDAGKIIPFEKVNSIIKPNRGLIKNSWQLPYLALYGRSDNTIIFYAANIYPEHIHAGLHNKEFLNKLTGKFSMRKGYLKNMDEYLEVNIELRLAVQPSKQLSQKIKVVLFENLKRINAEYLFLTNHLDKNITPRIKLWPYQHQLYFKPGLKPKYILKD
jgi:phenylacetate-CoA ligase